MTRDDAVQEIRRNWKYFYPPDKSRKGILCPLCGNGSGSDGDGIRDNPKSKKPGSLTCFKCGFKGDVLDLLQQSTGADYSTALSMAADTLGITIDPYKPTAADDIRKNKRETAAAVNKAATPAGDGFNVAVEETPQAAPQDATEGEQMANYTAYYEKCRTWLTDPAAVSYLQARGISPEMAAARSIGYDPEWISPAAVKNLRAQGKDWTPQGTARIIIPVTRNHYIARAVYDDKVEKKYRKQNETGGGEVGIFGWRELHKNNDIVFVTEGAFDALSIMEVGRHAVALNSTSNAKKFIKMLQEQPPKKTTFILCLDEDAAGQEAGKILKEGMEQLNIRHITANICCGHKDPNDALVADRAAFIASIQQAETQQPDGVILPGLLSYNDAVNVFEKADNEFIEIKPFPIFKAT